MLFPEPVVAGIEGLSLAALGLGLGYLITHSLTRSPSDLDWIDRLALAFPCLCLYSVLLLILHVLTGGRVFSNPGLVRTLTLIVGAVLLVSFRRRTRGTRVDRSDGPLLLTAVMIAAAVWGLPAFLSSPLPYSQGDSAWHLGWAMQLINGERLPETAIIASVPNYYPWLFHSLVAFLTDLLPTQITARALASLQFAQVTGMVLALFALGRRLTGTRVGAFATVVFGAITGGFGYLVFRRGGAFLPRSQEAAEFLGDFLFVRSYNLSFTNLAPPLPRDITFVLLVCSLLMLVKMQDSSSKTWYGVWAGTLIGLAGLGGIESLAAGLLTLLIIALVRGNRDGFRHYAVGVACAAAVYGLWLIPYLIAALAEGGMINTTVVSPVTLTPFEILFSWGIMTFFAVAGIAVALKRADPRVLVPGVLAMAAVALVMSASTLPRVFGGSVTAIGRAHRYWPFVYLALSLFAAIGLQALLIHIRTVWKQGLTIVVIVGIAISSPIVASSSLHTHFAATRPVKERSDLYRALYQGPGRSCNVAAPQGFRRLVFSDTGYRLLSFARRDNDGRIRWRKASQRGTSSAERFRLSRQLTRSALSTAWFHHIATRFDIDAVIASRDAALQQPKSTYRHTDLFDRWVLIRVTPDCADGASARRAESDFER